MRLHELRVAVDGRMWDMGTAAEAGGVSSGSTLRGDYIPLAAMAVVLGASCMARVRSVSTSETR